MMLPPSIENERSIDTLCLARLSGDVIGGGCSCWSCDNQLALVSNEAVCVIAPEGLIKISHLDLKTKGIFSSITHLKDTSITQLPPLLSKDAPLTSGQNSRESIERSPATVKEAMITSMGSCSTCCSPNAYISSIFGGECSPHGLNHPCHQTNRGSSDALPSRACLTDTLETGSTGTQTKSCPLSPLSPKRKSAARKSKPTALRTSTTLNSLEIDRTHRLSSPQSEKTTERLQETLRTKRRRIDESQPDSPAVESGNSLARSRRRAAVKASQSLKLVQRDKTDKTTEKKVNRRRKQESSAESDGLSSSSSESFDDVEGHEDKSSDSSESLVSDDGDRELKKSKESTKRAKSKPIQPKKRQKKNIIILKHDEENENILDESSRGSLSKVDPSISLLTKTVSSKAAVAEEPLDEFENFIIKLQNQNVDDSGIIPLAVKVSSFYPLKPLRFYRIAWTSPLPIYFETTEYRQCLLILATTHGAVQLRTGPSISSFTPCGEKGSVLLFNFSSELYRIVQDWITSPSSWNAQSWPYPLMSKNCQGIRKVDWKRICEERLGRTQDRLQTLSSNENDLDIERIDRTLSKSSKKNSTKPSSVKVSPVEGSAASRKSSCANPSCTFQRFKSNNVSSMVDPVATVATCRDIPLMVFTSQRENLKEPLRFVPEIKSLCPWLLVMSKAGLNNPMVACCPNSVFRPDCLNDVNDTPASCILNSNHLVTHATICIVTYHSVATIWLIENQAKYPQQKTFAMDGVHNLQQMGVGVFCVGSIQLPSTANDINLPDLQFSSDKITSVALSQLILRYDKTTSPSSPPQSYYEFCLYAGTGSGRIFSYYFQLLDSTMINGFNNSMSRTSCLRLFHLNVLDVQLINGNGQLASPITFIECTPNIPNWIIKSKKLNSESLIEDSENCDADCVWWVLAYCQERYVGAVVASLNAIKDRQNQIFDGRLQHWRCQPDIKHNELISGFCCVPIQCTRESLPSRPVNANLSSIVISQICAVDCGGRLVIWNVVVDLSESLQNATIVIRSCLDLRFKAKNDQTGMISYTGLIEQLQSVEWKKIQKQRDILLKGTTTSPEVDDFEAFACVPKSLDTFLRAAIPVVRGLTISPSKMFFSVFRNYTNSKLVSVTGQLMDLHGALVPKPCIVTRVIMDLVEIILVPLDNHLKEIQQFITPLTNDLEHPNANQTHRECDQHLEPLVSLLCSFILSREPLKWWDVRLALWGTPKSRQTTLLSFESVKVTTGEAQQPLQSNLKLPEHIKNYNEMKSVKQTSANRESFHLYDQLIHALGEFDFSEKFPVSTSQLSPNPSEPISNILSLSYKNGSSALTTVDVTTLRGEFSLSLHGLTDYGVLISFLLSHLAELCGQPLNATEVCLDGFFKSFFSELIVQIKSIFSSLSQVCKMLLSSNSNVSLLVVQCYTAFYLTQSLAAVLAIIQPPFYVKSDLDFRVLWTSILKGRAFVYRNLLAKDESVFKMMKSIENESPLYTLCPLSCGTQTTSYPPYKTYGCQKGHQMPSCSITMRPLCSSSAVKS